MRTLTAALVALSVIAVAPSWADVVELKTGQRVEGTFKQATPAGVVIEVGGQTITFEQEKVRAIYFGSAPSSPAQPSAAIEALKALRALQSVTSGSVNYQDYAPRVNDVKIVVDRYLAEPERGDASVKDSMRDAMAFYVLASSAWNARITNSANGYIAAGSDPALQQCQQASQAAHQYARGSTIFTVLGVATPNTLDLGRGLAFSGIPGLWSCASDKIREVKTGLAAPPTETQK